MTVAVMVKVFDGLVLAADSATTMMLANGGAQVYNNANKIFHLHRHLPVGGMTWGLGNIGDASISTIAKDLRRRLMGKDTSYADWKIDPDSYTMLEVAERAVEIFYDELYVTEYAAQPPAPGTAVLGFLISGYSAGVKQPEAWLITIDGTASRPQPFLAAAYDVSGWVAYAQPEATSRLFNGFDPNLGQALEAVLEQDQWVNAQQVLTAFRRSPTQAAMPFADAIALAKFMVDVTIGYSRYLLGPDTVGGRVEVAAINRHEGFKWVSRKHYYSNDINPEEPRHAY